MKSASYALVTGASSGIGFQYAREMARRHYNLIIVSNEDAIHTRADELRCEFPSVSVVDLVRDLSVESAAKELYDYCQANSLSVEVLINNAGVYHDRDFVEDSDSFNALILKLHVLTPAMLCYYFSRDMVTAGRGYILNMCSVAASIPVQRLATYCSTKSFLKRFTRSLHIELHNRGVRVIDVSPGAVNTGLYNISQGATRVGLTLGYIVSPEYLARRAVRAMFRGRASISIPSVWNAILRFLIALIPTCLLRLIRRLHIF